MPCFQAQVLPDLDAGSFVHKVNSIWLTLLLGQVQPMEVTSWPRLQAVKLPTLALGKVP